MGELGQEGGTKLDEAPDDDMTKCAATTKRGSVSPKTLELEPKWLRTRYRYHSVLAPHNPGECGKLAPQGFSNDPWGCQTGSALQA